LISHGGTFVITSRFTKNEEVFNEEIFSLKENNSSQMDLVL